MADARTTGNHGLLERGVAFARLGRLQFLAGGFVMYGLGTSVARYFGASFDLPAWLGGQAVVTAAQLMVHYANDYFDLDADRANHTPTPWSGGSRVLVDGGLPPRAALVAGAGFGLLAASIALYVSLVLAPGPWTLPLLASGIILSWGYSAPPLRLHRRGLGQLTGAAVVALLTPLAGFYLQAGQLAPIVLLAIVPLLPLQFAMLLAVDIPDISGDRAAGKQTLAVRAGEAGAERLYAGALAAAYLLLPAAVLAGLPPLAALAVALGSPIAVWLIVRTAAGAWRRVERRAGLVFWSIALLIGSAVAEAIAFLLLARGPA